MSSSRGTSRRVRPNRGQTALIGIVLLIGMVATVSMGIFLVAGEAVTSTEQQTENERVEQAFVELSQTMTSASSSNATTHSIDMDLHDRGAVVMKNTSRMTIEYGNQTEEIDFGTIEYEGDDGTRIAYQGGGVFRETGNETRVVSAPPVSYVNDRDSETLSFPIIEPTEEGSISSGGISASKAGTDIKFSETVENSEVTLEIQGPYYRGWETYFERQAGEGAIDSIDHENNSVTILLTQSSLGTLYDYGVVTGGDVTVGSNAADIDGPVLYGGNLNDKHNNVDGEEGNVTLEPIDDEIHDKIETANNNVNNSWNEISKEEDVSEGKYFAGSDDDLDIGGSTFNVSDGDIIVVVDGDLNVGSTATVEGIDDGHTVQFYTNGSFDLGSNDLYVKEKYDGGGGDNSNDEIHSKHLEIYGTSEFDINLNGNAHGEGIIYAPGADLTQQSGTQSWYGTIIGDSFDINGDLQFTYDESLEGGPDIDSEGGIPEIVYLNIVQHDIEIGT